MKQLQDNAFDSMVQMTGSIPSPALSQMSNMSNTKRFIKLIGGRERGRKNKSMKMSAGQPGFGSPWSLFEDQSLVVLVHDMGPNWELISDAINSTGQFKVNNIFSSINLYLLVWDAYQVTTQYCLLSTLFHSW
ncbi:hypothetical protein OIU77_002490 [Salix suchowensis]|uniref:Uncharacterized protein n=1 Tax=Salix suchowensis TaxID=1278906 RepID=A0ABQ9AXL8_9ROSI|nr:hypothetical protein OIU77_002490 [Salix suchowensis]